MCYIKRATGYAQMILDIVLFTVVLFPVVSNMDEHKTIRGFWEIVELKANGETFPISQSPKKERYVFVRNKFIRWYGDVIQDVIEFKIDTSGSVQKIDFHMNDQSVCKGIYRIRGDQLTICWAVESDRPMTFEAPKKSRRVLVVAKRIPNPGRK